MIEHDINTLETMEKSGDQDARNFAMSYQNSLSDERNKMRRHPLWVEYAAKANGETVTPINDGGPAFPHEPYHYSPMIWSDGGPGMTLRDYFAAHALAGYFAAPHTPHHCDGKATSEYIWSIADAMIAARDRKEVA